jgi:hypothetical protein
MLYFLLPFLFGSALGDRIVQTNTALREEESHAPVKAGDASLVHAKLPGACGWDRVKECFGLVGVTFASPCAWSPACEGAPGACGFSEGHRILLWRSQDLGMGYWQPPLELLPAAVRPPGVYRRPQLLAHPSGSFVLWVRRSHGGASSFLAATAPSLEAPFSLAGEGALGPDAGGGSVFVEGTAAYLLHAPGGGAAVVTRLNDAWTAPAAGEGASSAPVGPGGTDVPLMAKRGGTYYLMLGQRCCFCREGSDTLAFAGTSPLGPFAPAGRLGTVAGAQATFLFAHPQVEDLLWGGHRWGARTQAKEHARALAASSGAPSPEEDPGAAEAEGYLLHLHPLEFFTGVEPANVRPLVWRDIFRTEVR